MVAQRIRRTDYFEGDSMGENIVPCWQGNGSLSCLGGCNIPARMPACPRGFSASSAGQKFLPPKNKFSE